MSIKVEKSSLETAEEIIDKRENLYTAFEERGSNLGKNYIFQRIIIISKIKNEFENNGNIGTKYESFVNETSQKLQMEAATGFLMIQQNFVIHVVEGPMKMILLYMREVNKDSLEANSNFENSKVLVISNDVSITFFQIFHWLKIDIEVVDTDFKTGEGDEKLVIDIINKINSIGEMISKTPKQYIKNSYISLFENNAQLIPSQGVLNYLLKENLDCISTVEEMLEVYDTKFEYENPSDEFWPLPTRKYPYNEIF